MNEVLSFLQDYGRWIAPPLAFFAGQFLSHRRSAALRNDLATTRARLEDTQVVLEHERGLRKKRDEEQRRAAAMIEPYLLGTVRPIALL